MISSKKNSPHSFAYSPCPNDTFCFHHFSQNKKYTTHLHDIETLNEHAFEARYDITKLSFHAWFHLQDTYQLLSVGSAFGDQSGGPLLIQKKTTPLSTDAKIALPGKYTTAHLLFNLRYPNHKNRIFIPFHQIIKAVQTEQADAGVIIHESQFLFKKQNLHCTEDLGKWWAKKTNIPLPLGCLVAKKTLPPQTITTIETQLVQSIQLALKNPKSVWNYVKKNAQELDDTILHKHIQTYVNTLTLKTDPKGLAAIKTLQSLALPQ